MQAYRQWGTVQEPFAVCRDDWGGGEGPFPISNMKNWNWMHVWKCLQNRPRKWQLGWGGGVTFLIQSDDHFSYSGSWLIEVIGWSGTWSNFLFSSGRGAGRLPKQTKQLCFAHLLPPPLHHTTNFPPLAPSWALDQNSSAQLGLRENQKHISSLFRSQKNWEYLFLPTPSCSPYRLRYIEQQPKVVF